MTLAPAGVQTDENAPPAAATAAGPLAGAAAAAREASLMVLAGVAASWMLLQRDRGEAKGAGRSIMAPAQQGARAPLQERNHEDAAQAHAPAAGLPCPRGAPCSIQAARPAHGPATLRIPGSFRGPSQAEGVATSPAGSPEVRVGVALGRSFGMCSGLAPAMTQPAGGQLASSSWRHHATRHAGCCLTPPPAPAAPPPAAFGCPLCLVAAAPRWALPQVAPLAAWRLPHCVMNSQPWAQSRRRRQRPWRHRRDSSAVGRGSMRSKAAEACRRLRRVHQQQQQRGRRRATLRRRKLSSCRVAPCHGPACGPAAGHAGDLHPAQLTGGLPYCMAALPHLPPCCGAVPDRAAQGSCCALSLMAAQLLLAVSCRCLPAAAAAPESQAWHWSPTPPAPASCLRNRCVACLRAVRAAASLPVACA